MQSMDVLMSYMLHVHKVETFETTTMSASFRKIDRINFLGPPVITYLMLFGLQFIIITPVSVIYITYIIFTLMCPKITKIMNI